MHQMHSSGQARPGSSKPWWSSLILPLFTLLVGVAHEVHPMTDSVGISETWDGNWYPSSQPGEQGGTGFREEIKISHRNGRSHLRLHIEVPQDSGCRAHYKVKAKPTAGATSGFDFTAKLDEGKSSVSQCVVEIPSMIRGEWEFSQKAGGRDEIRVSSSDWKPMENLTFLR
jgi:hypothetical protein